MVAAIKPSRFFEWGTELAIYMYIYILAIVTVRRGDTSHAILFGQQSEPEGFEPPFLRVKILHNFPGLQDQLVSCYKVPFANRFGLGKLRTGWGGGDDRKIPGGIFLIWPLQDMATDGGGILGVRVQESHLIALRHQHGGGTACPCPGLLEGGDSSSLTTGATGGGSAALFRRSPSTHIPCPLLLHNIPCCRGKMSTSRSRNQL